VISFATLCFGLVYGVLNVEIRASGDVDRVDLVLDGRQVAELKAPFAAPVDLGWQPAPHELVAIGYDEKGRSWAVRSSGSTGRVGTRRSICSWSPGARSEVVSPA
jgi:hypothetical protein